MTGGLQRVRGAGKKKKRVRQGNKMKDTEK